MGESAISNILESMDIGGLSEKYCVALKQSLFLGFLYLVVAISAVLIVCVLVFGVGRQVSESNPTFSLYSGLRLIQPRLMQPAALASPEYL